MRNDVREDWGTCYFWNSLPVRQVVNGMTITMVVNHEPRGDSSCDMHNAHPNWRDHVSLDEAPPIMVDGELMGDDR